MAFCNFMAQTVQADGRDEFCRCRIFRRIHLQDLDLARELVRGEYDISVCFPCPRDTFGADSDGADSIGSSMPNLLSDFFAAIRGACDYASSPDEAWKDVFAEGGDIYCASASQMFHVPVVKHGINGHLRQKGKIAELALGYGGSAGALISMGALDMGLNEDELPELVEMWRTSNPAIVRFWRTVQDAAMDAIKGKPRRLPHGISFIREAGILFIGLPSGRRIAYVKPEIGENRFGGKSITYMGMDQTSKKWTRLETWGGKLVENIVQAFARDCLAESIMKLDKAGYRVVFHVHDEVILDEPKDRSSAQEVAALMGQPIEWAPGLPLNADAYECEYYRKD